jgi:hypothetical protein
MRPNGCRQVAVTLRALEERDGTRWNAEEWPSSCDVERHGAAAIAGRRANRVR